MKHSLTLVFSLLIMGLIGMGCAPTLLERQSASAASVTALQQSDFTNAKQHAEKVLQEDPENPYAALVAAVVTYKETMHQLFLDGQTAIVGAAMTERINTKFIQSILAEAEKELSVVSDYLAVAALESQLSMDLCVACLEVDWNQNGHPDDRDRVLLEVELDQHENPIPKGDPRRRPTFRFDHGDVLWAQAFVSFQRAALNIVSAYDWSQLARLIEEDEGDIRFRLSHPDKMRTAQKLILNGLSFSNKARLAYMAETDDEREWLPNPSQKNHPLPMPVDTALYETWGLVVGDLTRIVNGEEGLSVSELAQLGDHQWDNPPRGYLNIGKMLAEPKDIVINIDKLEEEIDDAADGEERAEVEAALRMLFGDYYVPEMKSSPILSRMERMKREVMLGHESFERKLRYLLWVN